MVCSGVLCKEELLGQVLFMSVSAREKKLQRQEFVSVKVFVCSLLRSKWLFNTRRSSNTSWVINLKKGQVCFLIDYQIDTHFYCYVLLKP